MTSEPVKATAASSPWGIKNLVQVERARDIYVGPPGGELTPTLRANFRRLLDDSDYAVFAGRQDSLKVIDDFLAGPSSILALTAPAGLGKTALLAHVVRKCPEAFAYHFLSARYDNGDWLDEAFFLRNMLQQLDPRVGALSSWDLPALRAAFRHILASAKTIDDKMLGPGPRTLLIDALDEASGWTPADYLSGSLTEGLKVIVSIRDTGQDWRREYGLPKDDRLRVLPLDGFGRDAVIDVFTKTGENARSLIETSGAPEAVMMKAVYNVGESRLGPVIHGADPIYIRFLAEDANSPGYTVSDLQHQPTGLAAYLDRWWAELHRVAQDNSLGDLLGILTIALGPLTRSDLVALIPGLFEDPSGFAVDYFDREVMPRIRRMVTGNDESGYALAHPRLGAHLGSKISLARLHSSRQILLGYCAGWEEHGSLYAITFYPSHLAAIDRASLPAIYQTVNYLESGIRVLGFDRFTGILRAHLLTDLPPETKESLDGCLRLLDRESHHFRNPLALNLPGYIACQIGLQALYSHNPQIATRARMQLERLAPLQLIPQWSSGHTHPNLLRTIQNLGGVVTGVALTADGSLALVAGGEGKVRVLDLATGSVKHVLKGHDGLVTEAAISTDGSRALTSGRDLKVIVWDLVLGIPLHTLTQGRLLALSADGTRALIGGLDGYIQHWDVTSREELTTLGGIDPGSWSYHGNGARAATMAGDGTIALTVGWEGSATVWDLPSGKVIREFETVTGPIAVSHDGSRAIIAGFVWNLSTGTAIHRLVANPDSVDVVAITDDGARVLIVRRGGRAELWNLPSETIVPIFEYQEAGSVGAVAIAGDGTRAITVGRASTARLWDLTVIQTSSHMGGHEGAVTAMAVTTDGERALTSARDGIVNMWDLTTGTVIGSLRGRGGPVAVTPDGTFAFTTDRRGNVLVWDMSTGNTTRTLRGHPGGVSALAVSADGTQVAATVRDGSIIVWSVGTGRKIARLKGTDGPAALLADGLHAVSADWNGTVVVWDVVRGVRLRTFGGQKYAVRSLAVSADGTRLLAAGWDGSARLWDATSGALLRSLQYAVSTVCAVAVTADGCLGLTGNRDGTVCLWDLENGQQLRTIAMASNPTCIQLIQTDTNLTVVLGEDSGAITLLLVSGIRPKSRPRQSASG